MRDDIRLLAAAALFGGWLVLFFLGHVAHGLIHLLPVLAVLLVPWKLRGASGSDSNSTTHQPPEERR
ncbi:MAG: hypothetical protein AB7G12_10675 [Thermoanaerobaculia bacterium]